MPLPFFALVLLMGIGSGCVKTTYTVVPPLPVLKTGTAEELTERLRQIGAAQSIKATVMMQLSIVSGDQTKREEYTDVRGFILAQRPSFARVQAQFLTTRAFDMASDGERFRVHLVWKKQFLEGLNALNERSEKRAENIRPQHVMEPLLLAPPQPDEIIVLDNVLEGRRPYQVLLMLKKGPDGTRIARKAWFERERLELRRLDIYDEAGDVLTRATYSGWEEEAGIPFAREVSISRPLDGYDLRLTVETPGLNAELPANAFVLEPPEGMKIERIGEPKGSVKAQVD